MPDAKLNLIAASLWDLRAQCEEQLRSLTDAQRLTDEYRGSGGQRDLLRRRLMADVEGVVRANAVIRRAAADCLRVIAELPLGDSQGEASPA